MALLLAGSASDRGVACLSFEGRWRRLPSCASGHVADIPYGRGWGTINVGMFIHGVVGASALHARPVDASVIPPGKVNAGAQHRADENGNWQMANGKLRVANGRRDDVVPHVADQRRVWCVIRDVRGGGEGG